MGGVYGDSKTEMDMSSKHVGQVSCYSLNFLILCPLKSQCMCSLLKKTNKNK